MRSGMLEPVQIVLATANRHKAEELRRVFPADEILLPADIGVDFDHEETGDTYLQNALGKATALFRKVGRPVMADDSGLSVAALGGAPGVLSARYGSQPGGPKLADADRIRQVAANLLENTLRYTDPGGRLAITHAIESEHVVMRFSDSAPGVAIADLPHLFDRFYRGDAARDRGSGGSGIGLTISRALARAHGGDLTATSPGPGAGATFTLSLPAR